MLATLASMLVPMTALRGRTSRIEGQLMAALVPLANCDMSIDLNELGTARCRGLILQPRQATLDASADRDSWSFLTAVFAWQRAT